LTEGIVHAAAIASTSVVMGFVLQSTIKKQGKHPAFRFGRNKNRYISGFTATVVIVIEIVAGIVLEELLVKPQITTLYEQNMPRIGEILAASVLGFFLNVWRPWLADKHRRKFVLLCVLAGYLLLNGLHIVPP
jgi:Co/Zn/Cd efflux system component